MASNNSHLRLLQPRNYSSVSMIIAKALPSTKATPVVAMSWCPADSQFQCGNVL